MLDLSWGELILMGMIALIVIGPKQLPTVLRTMGQWMTRIRRMASEFQGQFQEAMREAEFADLKKQVDEITDPVRGLTDYDPLESTRNEIESAFDDKPAPPDDSAGAEPAPPVTGTEPAAGTATAGTTTSTAIKPAASPAASSPAAAPHSADPVLADARDPLPVEPAAAADSPFDSADAPPAPEGGAAPARSAERPTEPAGGVGGGRAA